MAKTKLTQSFLARIEPGEKRLRIWDTELSGFFASVLPSGRISFYLKYRYEGVQKELLLGSYGALTVNQGRTLARKASGEIAAGLDPQALKKQKRKDRLRQRQATLGVFIAEVYGPYLLTECKDGDASVSRLNSCFSQWFSLPMIEINEFRVMGWRRDEIKRGLTHSTINRSISLLKACLNQAQRADIIETNPLKRLANLKEDKHGHAPFLSVEQEQRLRTSLSARDRVRAQARQRTNSWRIERRVPTLPDIPFGGYSDHLTPIVLFAINTGLRRGELFSLRWSHLDPDLRRVMIEASNAKSRSTRYVPLNREAQSVIRKWRASSGGADLVFPSPRTGRPLKDIKKAWHSIRKDADLGKFKFHSLRHHFASRLVMEGVPLNTVRDLLGHADLNTTLRYAHLAPSHREEAVALLDRVPN